MLNGCASLSKIRSNLRQVDQIIAEPKIQIEQPKEIPSKKIDYSKPVPLSVYTGGRMIQSEPQYNRWYSKMKEWTKTFRDIAQGELDIRNLTLSQKYSQRALLWAERSAKIKKSSDEEAFQEVAPWLEEFQFPSLEPATNYFLARDIHAQILKTKEQIESTQPDQLCLIRQGVRIVQAQGLFELAVDLFNQKFYTRAGQVSQNASSQVDNIDMAKQLCAEDSTE